MSIITESKSKKRQKPKSYIKHHYKVLKSQYKYIVNLLKLIYLLVRDTEVLIKAN